VAQFEGRGARRGGCGELELHHFEMGAEVRGERGEVHSAATAAG